MDTKIDKLGNQIPVSYFGNLKHKQDVATGYIRMYNQVAADKNRPQMDMVFALDRIAKQHDRFYGNDNKYDGKGNLK